MRPHIIDLTGKKFGIIDVLSYSRPNSIWNIRCGCGKEREMKGPSIRASKSCGCIKSSIGGIRSFRHGEATRKKVTTEYRVFSGLIRRCENQNDKDWKYYGGRGITVCSRWRDSFENFLEDMGRKPSPTHSIDRIDNDGNYEPANCRWATKSEQMRNRRKWKIKK